MTNTSPPALYHYACEHTYRVVGERPVLMPARFLLPRVTSFAGLYLWMTDLATPDKAALGLRHPKCDRTEYRFRILQDDLPNAMRWLDVAPTIPDAVTLEEAVGTDPRHWWVSTLPVRAVLDQPER